MTLQISLKSSLIFFLFLCNSATKINGQTSNQFNGYEITLNKKTLTVSNIYYLMTKATNSTVLLYWGNDNFKRRYRTDLDLPSAEKLHIKWTNRNYLILQYGTGSGVWVDIVLPNDNKEKPQEILNGVCFDKTYNLFAYEGYKDTILIIRNLKTKREQLFIDKEHRCDASNNDCINSVKIKNKLLYIEWTIPNNFTDEKKKVYNKKIKLRI